MDRFLRFASVILILSFSGCASVQHRQNIAISKGIYAEHAAIVANRFDLAEKFDEQLTRLVPPPRAPVTVKPFMFQGQSFTVLPQTVSNAPVIVQGDSRYNQAIAASKPLESQIAAESEGVAKFTSTTDGILRAKDAEAAKYEAEKPSWIRRILGWVFKLSPLLLIIGAVCLCIFFPPAIPFVIAGVRFALHLLKSLLKSIVATIEGIEAKLEGKGNPPSG